VIQGNTPRVASINGKVSSATATAGSISGPYEPAYVGESSVTPIYFYYLLQTSCCCTMPSAEKSIFFAQTEIW